MPKRHLPTSNLIKMFSIKCFPNSKKYPQNFLTVSRIHFEHKHHITTRKWHMPYTVPATNHWRQTLWRQFHFYSNSSSSQRMKILPRNNIQGYKLAKNRCWLGRSLTYIPSVKTEISQLPAHCVMFFVWQADSGKLQFAIASLDFLIYL